MKRGLVSAAYIAAGSVIGMTGLVVMAFAVIPLAGTLMLSITTEGKFPFVLTFDPNLVVDLVIMPVTYLLFGIAIGFGGLGTLSHGIARAWPRSAAPENDVTEAAVIPL